VLQPLDYLNKVAAKHNYASTVNSVEYFVNLFTLTFIYTVSRCIVISVFYNVDDSYRNIIDGACKKM